MPENVKYYIIKRKVLPEVFLKVVEAKLLLERKKVSSVQEAVDKVGISRSSFYKYKDSIFPFQETERGSIITFAVKLDDEPGLLSRVLNKISEFKANILTINQSIPINGVADVNVSIEILPESGDVQTLINTIDEYDGIHQIKILARE